MCSHSDQKLDEYRPFGVGHLVEAAIPFSLSGVKISISYSSCYGVQFEELLLGVQKRTVCKNSIWLLTRCFRQAVRLNKTTTRYLRQALLLMRPKSTVEAHFGWVVSPVLLVGNNRNRWILKLYPAVFECPLNRSRGLGSELYFSLLTSPRW